MDIPLQKRTRVSYEQRQKMLEFMLAHPDFSKNRVAGADAARKKIKLQTDLAVILNACATGASKSPEKWIKGWRSDVKAKAARIQRVQQQTGGGVVVGPALSSIEVSLMAFIGHEAAEGLAVADTLEIPEYNREVEEDTTEPNPVVENPKIPKKRDKLEESLDNQAAAMDQLSLSMNNLAAAINNLATALHSITISNNQV